MRRHRPWLLGLVWLSCTATTIAAPFWFAWLLTRTGYVGTILVLAGLYVGLHWLMEPFRPPWEASLFGTRGAARIRRRRWLNPTRAEH